MSRSAPPPRSGCCIRSPAARGPGSRCRREPVAAYRSDPPAGGRAPRGRADGRPSTSPPCRTGRRQPRTTLRRRRVDRQRLLAEHVLARLEGDTGVVEMRGVRGGDVDDVDVGVGHQRVVRRVSAGVGVAVLLGEGLGRPGGREPTAATQGARDRSEVVGEGRWQWCRWPGFPSRSSPSCLAFPGGVGATPEPSPDTTSGDSRTANDIVVVRRLQWWPHQKVEALHRGETAHGRRERPPRATMPGPRRA